MPVAEIKALSEKVLICGGAEGILQSPASVDGFCAVGPLRETPEQAGHDVRKIRVLSALCPALFALWIAAEGGQCIAPALANLSDIARALGPLVP